MEVTCEEEGSCLVSFIDILRIQGLGAWHCIRGGRYMCCDLAGGNNFMVLMKCGHTDSRRYTKAFEVHVIDRVRSYIINALQTLNAQTTMSHARSHGRHLQYMACLLSLL